MNFIKLSLILIFLVNIVYLLPTSQQQNFIVLQAPALLLTTYDSVSIVYPKEMGYEKDFLQIIFKITQTTIVNSEQDKTNNKSLTLTHLRIEDAVYDQQQSTIYLVLSYTVENGSNGGCEVIRLKHQHHHSSQKSEHTNRIEQQTHSNYHIATNWQYEIAYKNTSISILSMQLNDKKRKLYWLEYNYQLNRWSIVIMKLQNEQQNQVKLESLNLEYFTFAKSSIKFSYDGYSYISIIYDTFDDQYKQYRNKLQPQHAKSTKKAINGELIVFITNNQTLNICFLSNLTCRDFFKPFDDTNEDVEDNLLKKVETSDDDEYYDYYNEYRPTTSTTTTTTTDIAYSSSITNFGRLMGIQYDSKERTLYVADYGYDRIEKILLEINTNLHLPTARVNLNDDESSDINEMSQITIKPSYIQTLVQSSPGQLPINPIMSVIYENTIFWTDFEDGLKSTIYKSPCIRPVYRIKNATTLKLININVKTSNKSFLQSNLNINNYRSLAIEKNQFKYPPDYYLYYHSNDNSESFASAASARSDFEALQYSSKASSTVLLIKQTTYILVYLTLISIHSIIFT